MSTPPPTDISPPLYDPYDTESCSDHSPTYTEHALDTEVHLIQDSVDFPTSHPNNPTSHWAFETKHMKINIGPQLWPSLYPTYGLNAKIEGSISLSIAKDYVEKVAIALELEFSTSIPTANGTYLVTIPLQNVLLYDATTDFSQWRDEIPFSIAIPSTIKLKAQEASTPPTFRCNHYARLEYSLKVSLMKKKSVLRKLESKTIPIRYLPKTYPLEPPLNTIPRPASLHSVAVSPTYLHSFDRVLTSTLSPFWPPRPSPVHPNPNVKLSSFQNCINFSLPTPSVFASGSSIPFAVSVYCPEQPALPEILFDRIRVVLYRRVSITSNLRKRIEYGSGPGKHHEYVPVKVYGECPLSTGCLRYKNEYDEGIILYRGYITAGSTGKECSFRIPGMFDVEYILRVMVEPPNYMQEHVPSFSHEVTIDLTTDQWGTVDRELAATGGMTTPALGMMNRSTLDDEYVSGWVWTL